MKRFQNYKDCTIVNLWDAVDEGELAEVTLNAYDAPAIFIRHTFLREFYTAKKWRCSTQNSERKTLQRTNLITA